MVSRCLFLRKEDAEALLGLRKLLARYAEAFPDARAAYALILFDRGEQMEAEPWPTWKDPNKT